MQGDGRNYSLQQAADRASRADIHRAQLEHHVTIPRLLVNIDIIHPYDFAAMNIDDLLVEQIARQKQHAFAAGVG